MYIPMVLSSGQQRALINSILSVRVGVLNQGVSVKLSFILHPPSSVLHPVRTNQPVVTHAVFEREPCKITGCMFFHRLPPSRQTDV